MAEIGRELAGAGSTDERISRAMRVLDRRLGAARLALFSVGATGEVSVESCHGVGSDQFRPRAKVGVVGRVAESGQPIVVPLLRHDAMALGELAEPAAWVDHPWSLVAVPINVSGRCSAVLSAYFRHRDVAGFSGRVQALDVAASLMWRPKPAASARPPKQEEPHTEPAGPAAQFEYANMVGASAAMRQVYEQVGQVARTNATALLRGESGTGKELVAHAIHRNSPRAQGPFLKVNCAALPESLFESELFGHERGAFTGALSRKKGRFELARGGTLFLDEIGELSLTTQAKLLRVLQFREFERLGGTETLRTDLRLIAATNADIERAVAAGTFREDLYYRLNVFTITLPPLRERRTDIPALAEHFLGKFTSEHGRRIGRIASGALELLTQHSWPGNARELENVIERAVVVCDGFVIQEHHLPSTLREATQRDRRERDRAQPAATPLGSPAGERLTLSLAVERLERQMLEEALREGRGCIAHASRALGTTERIVRYKAAKLGVEPGRYRG